MRGFKILCFLLVMSFQLQAQLGIGLTGTSDLYHRYVNPSDEVASPAAGSAIMNLGVGPKLWVGAENFSFSVEGQAVLGVFAFSAKDYKGLGSLAFPIMAKINFSGLSSFSKDGKLGFSIGGGLQYSKTELFGLHADYAGKGVVRDYFETYIVQAGYGFGLSGFTAHLFGRYGWSPDHDGKVMSIGIQYDFNIPMLKKIADPASAL